MVLKNEKRVNEDIILKNKNSYIQRYLNYVKNIKYENGMKRKQKRREICKCIKKTRKLTRLRRRIGLQVKLFLLNLYVVGRLPCILKSNWIGLQVKLGRGEREREREK